MVIVIDDFAVDSNTVQPTKAPVVPPVTPLYDDNTMYNATVYPGQQVFAPSAAEQPVVYQSPMWEEASQTYRDPASGLLWLDDGTPGGQWVSDAEYSVLKPSTVAPYAKPLGAVQLSAGKVSANLPGMSPLAIPPDYGVPDDALNLDYSGPETTLWSGGSAQVSDQEAYTQLSNPYAWEDTTTPYSDADRTRLQTQYQMGPGTTGALMRLLGGSRVYPLQNVEDAISKASHGIVDIAGEYTTQPLTRDQDYNREVMRAKAESITAPLTGPGSFDNTYLSDLAYNNPLYQGGPSRPAISADDLRYPTEARFREWLQNWPYYTPETREMLSQVMWEAGRVDVTAEGGGGYAPWDNNIHVNRIDDEPLVHELAHAYYKNDPVMSQKENRVEFVESLRRLATDPDPAYAWPAYLAKQYLATIDEELGKGKPTYGNNDDWAIGGEQHGGLWSGVMGNIYQLPPYMRKFYAGMFDTTRFGPEDVGFRTGSGYEDAPVAYGPPLP